MTAVHQAPSAGPPPPGPPPGAVPATRRAGGPPALPGGPAARREPRTGAARLVPRTVASRIRAVTVLVLIGLAGMLAVTWAAVDDARDGVRVIGHDAGPQVVATGDLYTQLINMDARLADALLIGRTPNLEAKREQALREYDNSRRSAGTALLQAAKLADDDTEERTARELLDAVARYEGLAGRALLLDQQTPHTAGPPPETVLKVYRQATDLMKLDLLPKAYNLTLDNGTLVRHTYEDKQNAVSDGRLWVMATGVVLLALLVGLQLFLAARFRRMLNPALALATVATLVLLGVSFTMLGGQADQLRKAKEDGFDSILALSRARAIGNSANADQTRFLLDPARADTYEQIFLSKSQTILYVKADSLAQYSAAVQTPGREREYLGFLGTEFSRTPLPGQDSALTSVFTEYRAYQRDDRALRDQVANGQRQQAITARLARSGSPFGTYDVALTKLIKIHQTAFDDAIEKGDGGTAGWNIVIPIAGLALVVLVLVGVRPRLSEYR
ncbi:hypothetical protein ACGFNU_09695 [Spirillospora sp. NPDC048911]|uniref:hypothetical protein n=1 Tax=Spirillospora sp. NPDC048911 TaxID=3364527 RepID=UPI003715F270